LNCTQGSSLKGKRGSAPPSQETTRDKKRAKIHITIDKQRESTTRCGCKFVIKYTPAGKNAPPKAVRITHGSYYRHTNGCLPCQTQLIADKRRTGLKQVQLRSIIEVLKPRKPVPIEVLREMVRPLYTATVEITAQDVCSMRFKVNRILERMEKESEETDGSGSDLSSSDEDILLLMDDGSVLQLMKKRKLKQEASTTLIPKPRILH
jgi:hypothetical protein